MIDNEIFFQKKQPLKEKTFKGLLIVIFLFVIIFSVYFLIANFISKQELIQKIINGYKDSNGQSTISIKDAEAIFNSWSLPIYFGGLSMVLIFFIFVLFARTNGYGLIFRTFWAIIFVGASIFIFFSPYDLWLEIIIFILLNSISAIMVYEIILLNKTRALQRTEILQDYRNKKVKGRN
ncbi:MAG: hypothetical protein ACRDA7_01800 [Metamycoplasmataceae bacterium]